MSQLLQVATRSGTLPTVDGAAAPAYNDQGIPYDATGVAVATVGAIAYWHQGLPFVAVVADDQQWGISVTGHIKNHGQPLYSTLGPTRLDRVAQGFGCRGLRIDRKEDLPDAIRDSLSRDVPTVINVPIVPSSPAGN